MDRQTLLFDSQPDESTRRYTSKIEAPVYEPSHQKPHLLSMYDVSKVKALYAEIEKAQIPEDEKKFLRAAAWRHAVFHYERIADYYAYAGPEVQRLMEKSALVIVDFDSAIENGYVMLCDNIRRQFLEEHVEGGEEGDKEGGKSDG